MPSSPVNIVGRAALTLADETDGCELRLQAALAPARPFLRAVASLVAPAAHFGHDRLVTTGARQFETLALRRRPPLPS